MHQLPTLWAPVRKAAKLFMAVGYTICCTKKASFYFLLFGLGSSRSIHWMKSNE